MSGYKKSEAREWAKENLKGCSGVTIPSYSRYLKRLNEKAIRHDIENISALGFSYTLLCAEVSITPQENQQFTAWARDTRGKGLGLFFHAAWGTLAENVEAVSLAEQAGADLVLLSYPPQFWPTSEQEIYDYTKQFCDSTNLGVMLFPIPMWGFERIHPAGMSVELVSRILKAIPNIVAIKSEQGFPLFAGVAEMYHHFGEQVIISCPIEGDAIPLLRFMKMQFSGTSNTQWMSDYYPKAFSLAQRGEFAKSMELFWQVHPARLAGGAVQMASVPGTSVLNRTAWKYQDWLAGFNGGPLRAPASRVPDRFMNQLRKALKDSNLPVTSDPDTEFMVGRHPL
jgi:4-hydroxy-tetrahydrodipicolinate synthase